MNHRSRNNHGFTLVELLIVISILMTMTAILLPCVGGAVEMVRQARCLDNLHVLGIGVIAYAADNNDYLFPGGPCARDFRRPYFWGSKTNPVSTDKAPLFRFVRREHFLCPSLPDDEYARETRVIEPVTTYAYNAYCLDPESVIKSSTTILRRKTRNQIPTPEDLFVFADAANYNDYEGAHASFQNVSFLDPPVGMAKQVPMTHFRHADQADALCLDGHAAGFGLEGATMLNTRYNLSFVGKTNYPHYDQKNK